MSTNNVILSGTVRKIFKRETSAKGNLWAQFAMAFPDGERERSIKVTAFGDEVNDLLEGSGILVVGKLAESVWKDKETDEFKRQHEIRANSFDLVEGSSSNMVLLSGTTEKVFEARTFEDITTVDFSLGFPDFDKNRNVKVQIEPASVPEEGQRVLVAGKLQEWVSKSDSGYKNGHKIVGLRLYDLEQSVENSDFGDTELVAVGVADDESLPF